jgi:hypothetical protein
VTGSTDQFPRTTATDRLSFLALAFAALFGILILVILRWFAELPPGDVVPFADFDRNEYVRTGADAKDGILKRTNGEVRRDGETTTLPASANGFWFYDGGTFNGAILSWLFDCGRREDCPKAVGYLDGLRPNGMKPWVPLRYAVVMESPGFYSKNVPASKRLRSNPWDVRAIKNGLVYERADRDHRQMVYYTIDLDRNRVFYHCESGGFPANEYRPDDYGESRVTKLK